MHAMWTKLSEGCMFFLDTLDVAQLKRPVDTSDDREVALDNKALDAIAEAVGDRDFFACETEAFKIFSSAMSDCHRWLTGCPCHDHIWSREDWSAGRQQQEFEKETGCKRCWRRGRRGSELARGKFVPVIQKA